MPPKPSPPLPSAALEHIALRFRLLGEPQRLRILQALEPGELCVGDLCLHIGASQPNISKHLSALFQGGLIHRRKHGNTVLYSIADPVIFRLCELVCRSQGQQDAQQAAALRKASLTFAPQKTRPTPRTDAS